MRTATRRLEIDAGHRLLNHEGKCANYHGHRYVFDVTCAGDLDEVGRVVDFSVIKEKVGGWLDRHWDHGMVLQAGDPLVPLLRGETLVDALVTAAHLPQVPVGIKGRVFVMDEPPTAENLARRLWFEAHRLLNGSGVRVTHVRCWETPNCWSDYASPMDWKP